MDVVLMIIIIIIKKVISMAKLFKYRFTLQKKMHLNFMLSIFVLWYICFKFLTKILSDLDVLKIIPATELKLFIKMSRAWFPLLRFDIMINLKHYISQLRSVSITLYITFQLAKFDIFHLWYPFTMATDILSNHFLSCLSTFDIEMCDWTPIEIHI
jgi:hypothetical protein